MLFVVCNEFLLLVVLFELSNVITIFNAFSLEFNEPWEMRHVYEETISLEMSKR